jgi:hypothetical protein
MGLEAGRIVADRNDAEEGETDNIRTESFAVEMNHPPKRPSNARNQATFCLSLRQASAKQITTVLHNTLPKTCKFSPSRGLCEGLAHLIRVAGIRKSRVYGELVVTRMLIV